MNLKIEQIKQLAAKKSYKEAAAIAKEMSWHKVKDWNALATVINVQEAVGDYEEARDMAILAYNRNLGGRKLVYKLTEIMIKLKQFDDADGLYEEYERMSQHDVSRYILYYILRKAEGASDNELVEILEDYKNHEIDEKYMYELACLYAKTGRKDECIKACDELALLFQDGIYVEKSMELKQGLGAPLTTMQIKILDDAKLKKHDDEKTKEIMFEQQKELARIRQDDIEEAIKKEMKHTPVVTVGALGDPELMESIIAEGRADIVALARPLLADPELPNKLKAGQAEKIFPCLRCMACISESFVPYVRYCSRIRRCPSNPTAYKEIPASQVKKAEQPKKVLVIGGGPSGMEAAAELAERGHHVILCERENELGGAMRHAKYVPFKQKVDQLMHVMIRRLERSGAEIRLRTAATPTLVESLHPDVIVAALGAKAKKPEVAGAEHAIIAEDALQRIDSLGQNVAIVGGGLVGCELALQLGMTGRTVHLLSRKKEVCRDAAYLYREGLLMELKKVPVKIYNEAECTAITSEGVTVRNADAREYTLLADTVIWAGGYLPMEDEAEQFRTLAYDFWKIGDCAQVRKIYNARREGYNAGSNI